MPEPIPYTTHLGWRNTVRVGVLVHGSLEPVGGRVEEISLQGVRVVFDRSVELSLRAGDPVTLRIEASWLPRAVVAQASLEDHVVRGGTRVYGFRFASDATIEGQITPALHAIFNRRRAPRVVPAAGDDTRVALRAGRGEQVLMGDMVQVSGAGLLVRVEGMKEHAWKPGAPLGVLFRLPGRPQPLEWVAHVRDVRRVGQACLVGLELDGERTRDFAQKQGALLGYVLSRAPMPQRTAM